MLAPSEAGVHSDCILHHGSHRPLSVMLEGDWRGSPGCRPPVLLQPPLISFKPRVTTIFSLSYLLSFFQVGIKKKKKSTHQRSSASWGDHEDSTTYPFFFFLSFALSVFQEREDKERKPKNFDPWGGEAEVDLHY